MIFDDLDNNRLIPVARWTYPDQAAGILKTLPFFDRLSLEVI